MVLSLLLLFNTIVKTILTNDYTADPVFNTSAAAFLKVTCSEDLASAPVLTIESQGSSNDVIAVGATSTPDTKVWATYSIFLLTT